MQEINYILNSQTTIQEEMLSADGICLWIVWGQRGLPQNANDILQEAGALNIITSSSQSLWFFFYPEIAVNTLARLELSCKQFSIGVTAFAFPGKLSIGVDQSKAIEVPSNFRHLRTEVTSNRGCMYIHPNYGALATSIPGLSVYDVQAIDQHSDIAWKMITAERRLPFSVEQGWYAFVHPLGSPVDKQFQKGWETIFHYLEAFISENKLKYSLQDNFLIIPLENLNLLREWMKAITSTVSLIKEQHADNYWPCLNVVLDKNNLNFTPELPQKVNIDWESLSPDIPYISYKNAFVLGEEFEIHDLTFSSGRTSIDAFCTVTPRTQVSEISLFNVVLSDALLPNKTPCFYCGASNHSAKQCPSKTIPPVSPHFFEEFNDINLNEVNVAFREIDKKIHKQGPAAYHNIMAEGGTAGKLLRAIFAINHVIQLPNLARIWRINTREIDSDPEETANHKADPNQILLQRYIKCPPQDLHSFERECIQLLKQGPKNWHVHCLLGFIFIEKGDVEKAIQFWRDADGLCTVTLHQAWLKYLVGRAREVQGNLVEATEIYQHILRILPGWKDPYYRMIVCSIKRGFIEKPVREIVELVAKEPQYFHKAILDPELVRAQAHILEALQRFWKDAYNKFYAERSAIDSLDNLIKEWFTEKTNPVPDQTDNIRKLLELGEIKNYMLFLEISKERPLIEAKVTSAIDKQISELKNKYERALYKLEYVRDEMSWFSLQKSLTNFNTLFNECAKILNWAFGSDFTHAKTFKLAKEKLEKLEDQIVELERKLNMLRMVRDITLFTTLTLRTFVKISAVLVPLGVIGIFACIFGGEYLGLGQMQSLIKTNFWTLIKVVFSLTLMSSLGLASLKTTVLFDRKKNEMINKAKELREKKQRVRLERAKKFRASLDKNQQAPKKERY